MAVARQKTPDMADEPAIMLAKAGFKRPTPLQRRILPLILAHRDVAVEAPPGAGKTVAMVAAVLLLYRKSGTGAVAILLVPDADALRKVQRQWRTFTRAAASPLNLAMLGIEEGVRREARLLEARPEAIVATPQRLIDHIRQNNVDLSAVRFVCIDAPPEAPDFHRDVEFILSKCPSDRQIAAFLPASDDSGVAHLGGGRQQVILKAEDWAEAQVETAPEEVRRVDGSGTRRRTPPRSDGRDGVSKGTSGEARGDSRSAPPESSGTNEQSLAATIKGHLERMGQADASQMRRLTSILRRSVPLRLRGAFAAYLLRELTGGTPVGDDRLARLFINAGRNRRIFPNDIYDLFISQLNIQRSDFGEVRVLDNYSFVEIQARFADRAIAELTGKELRGRKLTVNFARPREGKQRE